jgi:two-component system chemotaxis sensor kinase CheA
MGAYSEEQIGEIPLELNADLDAELVEEFISEAREQLEIIEQGTLIRAFHTLKGNAGFLDFTTIGQLAHVLESLLDAARKNELEVNSVLIEIILKSRDTLKQFIDEIEAQITGKKPRSAVAIPTAALKATARCLLSGQGKPLPKPFPPAPTSAERRSIR